MRHKGFTHVEALILFVVIVILAAILFPVFFRAREHDGHSPHRTCSSNLKHIGLGIMQYAMDYDEKYPRVSLGNGVNAPYGWADALQPYIKSTQILQCPVEGNVSSSNPLRSGYVDYWFNGRLSGKPMAAYNSSASGRNALDNTLLSGDGNHGSEITDGRYSLSRFPTQWLNDTNSPAYRHNKMAHYLFADAHVKALSANQVQNSRNTPQDYSFAIK